MFAGPKYNEFTSSILVDGIPLVEQSGEAEPSDVFAVPTQKCYIPVKPGDVFSVQFKHHKRKPENKDFMVIVKIDGYEVNRAIISNSYHALTTIDAFFIKEDDAEGNTTYKRNTFEVSEPRRATDPRSVPPGLELGKIEVQVYRGTRIKPGNTSKLVDYKEPRWLSCVKAEQTRLCMKPGETTDADPYDAVNRWGFIGQARDKGDPWFQQVYEYRLLDDLYRDDLVTNDPTTPPKAPVVLPKRGYARVNGKVLETRIAALENQVNVLKAAQTVSPATPQASVPSAPATDLPALGSGTSSTRARPGRASTERGSTTQTQRAPRVDSVRERSHSPLQDYRTPYTRVGTQRRGDDSDPWMSNQLRK